MTCGTDQQNLSSEFRERLCAACAGVPEDAAMLLSGGLDSGSVLAALVESGRRPPVYTAQFGSHPNADTQAAQRRARAFGLEARVIAAPRDPERAQEAMLWTIRESHAVLKTAIEVLVIMKPVLQQVAAAGHRAVVCPAQGGGLWGVTKEPLMERARGGDAAWTKMRRGNFWYDDHGYPPSATMMMRWCARQLGLAWLDPLAGLKDWMLERSFAELNKPRPKALAVAAFPLLGRSATTPGALQVTARVREYMALLAQERGHSSALKWYNAEARRLGIPPRGDADHARFWREALCR